MVTYQSPSTPSVKHDGPNLITEAIMINRYGYLSEGSWRKGQPLSEQWPNLLLKVKRIIKTLKIDVRRLAWYVHHYKVEDLDYEEFGLLRWKINTYFKWYNLDWFADFYKTLHDQIKDSLQQRSSYVEDTVGYVTKLPSTSSRKTLTDILEELEQDV